MPKDSPPVLQIATYGGISAQHPSAESPEIIAAPATAGEFNTTRLRLIPVACWRVDDIRFAFDSSFVTPEIAVEMTALADLLKQHPGSPISIFGHADPVGSDDYNKVLSGRRATSIYALLTRNTQMWQQLHDQPQGKDRWGDDTLTTMEAATGLPKGTAHAALFSAYMDKLCGKDFKLAKTDFLAQGADPGGKGDFQGCSEFNPTLVFSSSENKIYEQSNDKTLRNRANAPNRRVVVFLFRKGSRIEVSKWPCPKATDGPAACRKRFWSDGNKRRTIQGGHREFSTTKDTFACRFYQRISRGSPCNSTAPPPALVHAAIAIKDLTFSGGHSVEKDTLGNFPSPEWLDSRSQADQSPISYKKNTKIQLTAKFKVTTQPSSTESVKIKGDATFGSAALHWTGTVSVSPTATEVTLSAATSSAPVPDQVDCFDAQDITWQMNPANAGWAAAGTTRNIVYVTLADPIGTNYWTLLDISCRAARGDSSPASLVSHVFAPLSTRSITRKRDGHPLTYWNPTTTRATNTQLLLAAADGSGQCGSWSEFLLDMYKVHGIANADKILIQRDSLRSLGFLVKNWRFNYPPPSSANSLTHLIGSECVKQTGIPGQTNPDPPPAFQNHFIVRVFGQFYDPSYGAGPFSDQLTWEKAAIDGLLHSALAGFDKSLNPSTKLLEFIDLTTGTRI